MRWPLRPAWPKSAGKLNLYVMSAAYVIFGASMIWQSRRWGSTPAYHILLQIFSAPVWGLLFLAAGVALGLAALRWTRRWIVVSALTYAFTLTTGWMLAFIVRYATSPNTTPETWVSWAVFDYLLLRVAMFIDWPAGDPSATRAAAPPGDDVALQAINEARRALSKAEEAYARATGQSAHHADPR